MCDVMFDVMCNAHVMCAHVVDVLCNVMDQHVSMPLVLLLSCHTATLFK